MKRAAALVALFLSFVLPSGAQDAFSPLIYAEEVAQTMKMIQQIQNQLREVSYIYQSLQNQIQSLSNMKMSSYSDFMSFLNGQASYVLTTESRIKALQIYVNGESYALGDVFGYWDAYKKKISDISQGKGTSSDEWAAYELLGMSSDLVTVGQQLKDLTTSAARKSAALAADNEKKAKTEQGKIDNLLAQSQGNQSIVAGLQTSALLQGEIAQELLDLKLQTGSLATNVASFTADVQRNGLPVARSAQDEAIVGEEIGNPISADFYSSR
jgi:conjugal transfer/entry exclusion protein